MERNIYNFIYLEGAIISISISKGTTKTRASRGKLRLNFTPLTHFFHINTLRYHSFLWWWWWQRGRRPNRSVSFPNFDHPTSTVSVRLLHVYLLSVQATNSIQKACDAKFGAIWQYCMGRGRGKQSIETVTNINIWFYSPV